jgi:protein tyrosine phosphatase (PTP) superfamily phosphohydrolase (DUF442 family)
VKPTSVVASNLSYQYLHKKALEQAGVTGTSKPLKNNDSEKKDVHKKQDTIQISQAALLAYQNSKSNG